MTDINANHLAYEFWRKKTWERIDDPSVAALLAPLKPHHAFGAKRPCLEQNYFEMFNRENVGLVDGLGDRIERVTPTGVETASGALYEVDTLVTATGYDSVIGGFKDVNIRGRDGLSLYHDGWKDGIVYTYMGLMTSGLFLPIDRPAFLTFKHSQDTPTKWDKKKKKMLSPSALLTNSWVQFYIFGPQAPFANGEPLPTAILPPKCL